MSFSPDRIVLKCFRSGLAALALLLLTVSCGGGGAARPDSPAPAGQRITSERVVLTVLPDTYIAGGKAQSIDVVERQGSGEILIDVSVRGAKELKAFFFHLEFDPARYGVGRLDNPWLLAPENECLALFLSDPAAGVVEFGELVMLPQELRADGSAKGFSGDGLLCTLHLKQGPAQQERRLSAAPDSDGARTQLEYDSGGERLIWRYFSPGDYNQDGRVAVSDLTPIGIHFGKDVPAGGDPDGRDDNSIEDVVDGSNDGKVNVADLTAIGLNFEDRVGSYNIYSGAAADLPASNSGPNGAGAQLVDSLPFSAATGDGAQSRLSFSFDSGPLQAGLHYWVRPNDSTDGSGTDGTASTSHEAVSVNQAPVPVISGPYGYFDMPPALCSFIVADSYDPDGNITLYEFDAEDDGNFEQSSVANPFTFEHIYDSPGLKTARMRFTDDDGATAEATWQAEVRDPTNAAPVLDVEILPDAGPAPLAVSFSLAASSDSDGSLVLYEMDLDGVAGYEFSSATETQTEYVYEDGGNHPVYFRVTDNLGSRTFTNSFVNVSDDANLAPIADLQADVTAGAYPLVVNFDASGSVDTDGEVVSYHWNFHNDTNEDDRVTSTPQVSFTYTQEGLNSCSVRVRDNDGVFSTPDSVDFDVEGGWRLVTAKLAAYPTTDLRLVTVADAGPTIKPLLVWAGTGDHNGDIRCMLGDETASNWDTVHLVVNDCLGDFDVINVGENAALAYHRSGGIGVGGLWFMRATTPSGSAWTARIEVDISATSIANNGLSAATVEGRPAIAYNPSLSASLYQRADDVFGNSWSGPTLLELDQRTARPDLIAGAQRPIVLARKFDISNFDDWSLFAYPGIDPEGSGFGAKSLLGSFVQGAGSGVVTDGVAGAAFSANGLLYYRRAADAEASAWQTAQVISNPEDGIPTDVQMASIAGKPAVIYEVYPYQLWYQEALDAAGSQWAAPLCIHGKTLVASPSLVSWNARPAVAFGTGSSGALYFLHLP